MIYNYNYIGPNQMLLYVYVFALHVKVHTFSAGVVSLTAAIVPQLPAHHLGFPVVPQVVTDGAPLVVDAYLHPP